MNVNTLHCSFFWHFSWHSSTEEAPSCSRTSDCQRTPSWRQGDVEVVRVVVGATLTTSAWEVVELDAVPSTDWQLFGPEIEPGMCVATPCSGIMKHEPDEKVKALHKSFS